MNVFETEIRFDFTGKVNLGHGKKTDLYHSTL